MSTEPRRVAVQLYSIREAVRADPGEAVARVAEIGYRLVEPAGLAANAAVLWPLLAEHGLAVCSAHQKVLGQDPHRLVELAQQHGVGVLVEPAVRADHWQDRASVERVARELNAAAEVARPAGVRVGYHNHHWELASTLDGQSAYEYLVGLLADDVVLELDTYWAAVGGADVPALLGRLGERAQLLHLKDGPVEHDVSTQTPLGSGAMPWPAVLAAAPATAVGIVEFDQVAMDPFQALDIAFAHATRSLGMVP